jgi:hypothetical protein
MPSLLFAAEAQRPVGGPRQSGSKEKSGEKEEHLGDWRTIADGQQTVYECRFCGKRFFVSQALGGHMNRHRMGMSG